MHHVAWHVDCADVQRMNVRPTPDFGSVSSLCRAFGSTRCWTRSRHSWRSRSTRSRARLIGRRSSRTGNSWRVRAIMPHASGCRLPVGGGSAPLYAACCMLPAACCIYDVCLMLHYILHYMLHVALYVALYVACCIVCCMLHCRLHVASYVACCIVCCIVRCMLHRMLHMASYVACIFLLLVDRSIVLGNYRLLRPKEAPLLGNVATLLQFMGGMDEAWFYLVTLEVCRILNRHFFATSLNSTPQRLSHAPLTPCCLRVFRLRWSALPSSAQLSALRTQRPSGSAAHSCRSCARSILRSSR